MSCTFVHSKKKPAHANCFHTDLNVLPVLLVFPPQTSWHLKETKKKREKRLMNAVSCQPNEGGVTPVKTGDSDCLTSSDKWSRSARDTLKDTVTNRMRDSYRSSRRWQFFLLIQSWSPVFVSDQSAHEELCSKFVTQAEIKTIYRSLQRRGTSSSPSRFMMESLSHGKDETQIPFARHFLRLWDIWATAKLASWCSAWN